MTTPTEAEVREAQTQLNTACHIDEYYDRKNDVTVRTAHVRTILSALQSAQADTARLIAFVKLSESLDSLVPQYDGHRQLWATIDGIIVFDTFNNAIDHSIAAMSSDKKGASES